jgi:hypothetical protein
MKASETLLLLLLLILYIFEPLENVFSGKGNWRTLDWLSLGFDYLVLF